MGIAGQGTPASPELAASTGGATGAGGSDIAAGGGATGASEVAAQPGVAPAAGVAGQPLGTENGGCPAGCQPCQGSRDCLARKPECKACLDQNAIVRDKSVHNGNENKAVNSNNAVLKLEGGQGKQEEDTSANDIDLNGM